LLGGEYVVLDREGGSVMRFHVRRWLVGLGIVTFTAAASLFVAPATAHAGDCYTVWVGPQGVQICP
jgi:hypothetical protein